MAQFGRRMRLRRMYEGSPEAEAPSPQYTDDSSRYFIDGDIQMRMQQIEDKAAHIDTTSRRAVLDSDRMRTKIIEIEADAQKSISDLTTGMERSLRSSAEARREIELTKDWAANYIQHQISHETGTIKSMISAEVQNLRQYFTMQLEGSSTSQAMIDTKLTLQSDAVKHQANDKIDKLNAKINVLESTAQGLVQRIEVLTAQCSENLETAVSREKAARERDVLETDNAIKQLALSYTGAMEREVNAAVKKNSEFAETSLERMQAIERLLKTEIRNRMDLASAYDKLVEDVRKVERATMSSGTRLETLINEKTSDLSTALTQHLHNNKENLSMLKDTTKQVIATHCDLLAGDVRDTRELVNKKLENLEAATSEVSSRAHEAALMAENFVQSIEEVKDTHQREVRELKNMINKAENKWDEGLSNSINTLKEHTVQQAQGATNEAVHREAHMRDQLMTEVKYCNEAIASQKKLGENQYHELRRVLQDTSASTSAEWDSSLARVTVLLQKSEELSKVQAEKSEQANQKMQELATSMHDVSSRMRTLETGREAQTEVNDKKAFRSELEVVATKVERVDEVMQGLCTKVAQTANIDLERVSSELREQLQDQTMAMQQLTHRVGTLDEAVADTSNEMHKEAGVEVASIRKQLETLSEEVSERGVYRSEVEVLTQKLLEVNAKLNDDKDMSDQALKDISSAVLAERKRLQELQEEVVSLKENDEVRKEGDVLWDDWRDTLTDKYFDGRKTNTLTFESFVRLLVLQEEQFQRAIIMTDMDHRELAERVELDFREGRKITENLLRFYEAEKSDYDKRAGSISH